MDTPSSGMRICPTPLDGRSVLFAHTIDPAECQKRQRGLYHKCFTCEFQNGRNGHAPTGSDDRPEAVDRLARLSR